MTPIDQIRKALEAVREAEKHPDMSASIAVARENFWDVAEMESIAALLASHDAAVQREETLKALILARELQHAAAIESTARTAAREMQERCAQVCQAEIENWRSVWPGLMPREVHALNVCIDSIRAIKE